jgi:hypothetical protein
MPSSGTRRWSPRRLTRRLSLAAAVGVCLVSATAHAQTQPPPVPPPAASAPPPGAGAPAPDASATGDASPPTTTTPAAPPTFSSPSPPGPPPTRAPAPAAGPRAAPAASPYAWPAPAYAYPWPYPYGYAQPPAQYPPAQYPPAPYALPPPLPPGAPDATLVAAAPPPGSARVPAEDPQADRGVLLPTAYTHPKGTWYLTDYDVVLGQVGYAFTDDTQLTLTGLPPLGGDGAAAIDVTLKTSLYRGGLVRVAGLGSASGAGGKDLGVLGIGRAGAVTQLCFERRCDSSVSLSTNLSFLGVVLMANGVSGIFRVGRTVSLLAELDTLIPLARDAGEFGGALWGAGVRFHWTSFGLDLAFVHVIGDAKATIPILALTYRSAS